MGSIWHEGVTLPHLNALEGDLERDAAVIGAGMTGILTAYYLQKRGLRVAVLEAGRVGSGQTGNTTAKITAQHGLIYDRLIREIGEEGAWQYARANLQAVEDYRRLISGEGIHCELEERPAYLYAVKDKSVLEKEAAACIRVGLPVTLTTHTTLPFQVAGALRMEGQAQFHPLKLLEALAGKLEIYENSRVLRVEGGEVYTDQGRIRASRVVFACHYPFVNFPGLYFLRMHQARSYVLALEGAGRLDGMYYGVERNGLSLRNAGEFLLLGGGEHRTGENRGGGEFARLREAAKRLYPGSREGAHWSAQDAMPLDGIAYIGRYAASRPEWYVATGFQKWGMSTAMVAARLLTGAIAGRGEEWEEVFSPQRFRLRPSAGNLLEEGKHAAVGLTRGLAAPTRRAPSGGQVSLRCPHLGCRLEWNEDEKSWDCPCHGSRFTADGALLDGPAQTGLKRK